MKYKLKGKYKALFQITQELKKQQQQIKALKNNSKIPKIFGLCSLTNLFSVKNLDKRY